MLREREYPLIIAPVFFLLLAFFVGATKLFFSPIWIIFFALSPFLLSIYKREGLYFILGAMTLWIIKDLYCFHDALLSLLVTKISFCLSAFIWTLGIEERDQRQLKAAKQLGEIEGKLVDKEMMIREKEQQLTHRQKIWQGEIEHIEQKAKEEIDKSHQLLLQLQNDQKKQEEKQIEEMGKLLSEIASLQEMKHLHKQLKNQFREKDEEVHSARKERYLIQEKLEETKHLLEELKLSKDQHLLEIMSYISSLQDELRQRDEVITLLEEMIVVKEKPKLKKKSKNLPLKGRQMDLPLNLF